MKLKIKIIRRCMLARVIILIEENKDIIKCFLGDTISIIMKVYCNEEWSRKLEQAWIDFLSPPRNENRANDFKNGKYYLPRYYKWKYRGYNDKEIKDLLKYH
tara:strand:+ start:137 stop:442 length:306 start_codon:yes stop_codon:yes gene_type:complete